MYEDLETVPVYVCHDPIEEAEMIAALEQAGIHCALQSFEDSAYDGLFTYGLGRSRILVLEKDVVCAERVVQGVAQLFEKSGTGTSEETSDSTR
jgi:hypothetical protein